jgi:ribosome-binding factor A
LARVRQGAKHAGEEDPYRKDGAEGSSGDLDNGLDDNRLDAEDTDDRTRQDD